MIWLTGRPVLLIQVSYCITLQERISLKGHGENTDGLIQVRYAEELGLGSSEYKLISI
jgi:uncharacterized Fe-S center protein